jgi:hypothetical protein
LLVSALAACSTDAPCRKPRPLTELNSPSEDRTPWLSQDELEIFFSSDRAGTPDLYHATRARSGDAFSSPELVAELSGPGQDYDPFLSDDALTIWFWRVPGDVVTAGRADRNSLFSSPQPEPSIAGRHPSMPADELSVYTASLHATVTEDIWVATRASLANAFGPTSVVSVSTDQDDQGPSISADGQTIWFGSRGLNADQTLQIGEATMTDGNFSPPAPISDTEYVAGYQDRDPQRRVRGGAIVFASDRPGGAGGLDIWIACE